MDVALCQEILRQAEQSGASSAALFVTSSARRTDSIRHHKSDSSTVTFESAKLLVQCANGCCGVELYSQNRVSYGRIDLMNKVQNACQAARLASVWGQTSDLLARELKRFEIDATSAVQENDCSANDKKSKCTGDCFSVDCLASEDLSGVLKTLDDRFVKSGAQSEYQAEIITNAVVETCYVGEKVTTQKHFDSVLKQRFVLKNSGRTLCLPDYRTLGKITDMAEHLTVMDAGDVAQRLEKSVAADYFDIRDVAGLCLSPWGMAVLGHEAAHLNVDISPGGRVVMNRAECLPVPASFRSCLGAGIKIALEGGLTRDAMFERLPDNTIVVDAPVYWMRKNNSSLYIHFESAWLLNQGKLERPVKGVVLKFDLQKIWFYCRFAAKPYARVAFKCGDGVSDFQAPWGFFEVNPKIKREDSASVAMVMDKDVMSDCG
ncbi:MAG: hypothetical protein IJU23_14860 [Proteobacteria bacterium]|nr:hypothetical protein [Pseudomonadota bacterium]